MNIKEVKTKQLLELQKICIDNDVNFETLNTLIEAEKKKKLQRKNHYIQETINNEIEKSLKNEI